LPINARAAPTNELATYTNFANNTDHCGSGLAREGGGTINIDVACPTAIASKSDRRTAAPTWISLN
jgi:hypothetical protein